MKSIVYSRWDGSQSEFSPDPESVLDVLSDLMMEGLDAREALDWMRRFGFELAGLDMRVMGLEELIGELRDEVQSLYDRYRVDDATRDLRRASDQILDREQQSLRSSHGYESARMNDFLTRRTEETPTLSQTIERFRDYAFDDERAGEEFAELLREMDRLRALEQFLEQRADRFRGQERADYETAQQIRERIEAIEGLARALAEGRFESIDPEMLGELLGESAAQSFILVRDLESSLRRAGYLRDRGEASELTPRAIRRIGAQALADVYGALRKDRLGGHETDHRGAALPRPDETKPFAFGDPLDLDIVRTLLNSVKRNVAQGSGPGHSGGAGRLFDLSVEDFVLRECDFTTQATTVLLLDMSWSMSWAGRFPAAKRVALALDQLVRTPARG